jgi:hypothetical protein
MLLLLRQEACRGGSRCLARFVPSRCLRDSCDPRSGFVLKSRLPIDLLTAWADSGVDGRFTGGILKSGASRK